MSGNNSDERKQEERQAPTHKTALGILGFIGLFILGAVLICAAALVMHAIGLAPFGRSFLGMVPFWDSDGMSVFERICQLFGW